MSFAAVAGGVIAAGAGIYSSSQQGGAAKGAIRAQNKMSAGQSQQTAEQAARMEAMLEPYAQMGQVGNAALLAQLGVLQPPEPPDKKQFYSRVMGTKHNGKQIEYYNQFNESAYNKAMANYRQQTKLYQRFKAMPGFGSLTKEFDLKDYKKDPGYYAPVNNLASWKKDVGYTPIPRTLAELRATPGYQFRLNEGMNDLNSRAAQAGQYLSGATLKAAQKYAQGFASTEYDNAWNRGQQAFQNAFARGQGAYSNAFNRSTTQKLNRAGLFQNLTGTGLNAVGAQNQNGAMMVNAQNAQMQQAGQNAAEYAFNKANANINGMNSIANAATQMLGNYLYDRRRPASSSY